MTYYKMILDNNIVGIACSNDFIAFSPVIESFLRSDEKRGEFISWHGNIYRDTWMQPIQFQVNFIAVQVREITEEEYQAFEHAFEINDEIEYEHEQEEINEEIPGIDPAEINSVEFLRDSKINEMSSTCRKAIENGFDLMLSDGKTHHFSLSAQDQMNLLVISTTLDTQEKVSYHADGELSKFYSAAEMKQIIEQAENHKNYHTIYFNALKAYINSLDNIDDIAAITYGVSIPDEFQSEVWKVLNK